MLKWLQTEARVEMRRDEQAKLEFVVVNSVKAVHINRVETSAGNVSRW